MLKKCDLSLFLNEVREGAVRILSGKAFQIVEPSNARQLLNCFLVPLLFKVNIFQIYM